MIDAPQSGARSDYAGYFRIQLVVAPTILQPLQLYKKWALTRLQAEALEIPKGGNQRFLGSSQDGSENRLMNKKDLGYGDCAKVLIRLMLSGL